MSTFPFGKSKILRDNYNEGITDRTIRSSMDVGPAKVRKRSTMTIRSVSFSMLLDDSDLNVLDNFYLANDTTVFDFVNPRTGATVKARFTEPLSYSLNETMWDVGVKLEVLP